MSNGSGTPVSRAAAAKAASRVGADSVAAQETGDPACDTGAGAGMVAAAGAAGSSSAATARAALRVARLTWRASSCWGSCWAVQEPVRGRTGVKHIPDGRGVPPGWHDLAKIVTESGRAESGNIPFRASAEAGNALIRHSAWRG
ncbi:hypothetical protein GCM10023074_11970 [Microbispora amethystogenes]|uniref:Uncharacterized protein n=1 Tax=Microbispora amethystogenes TaxID=1427754 RepID=A0ABQ4FN74_9ACTN|nr:hypothetical protein Mam01_63770 [Microbispora amethystogenes]